MFAMMATAQAACSSSDPGPSTPTPDIPRYTAEQVRAASGSARCIDPEYRGNGLWYCFFPWVFDEQTGRLFPDLTRVE
jgi:hypothetical protein